MTLSMKRLWSALHLGGLTRREAAVRTWQRIDEHAILTRAAAIAFYAIAALIPFMGLLVALTAKWLPWINEALGGDAAIESIDPVGVLLPDDAASFIADELERLRKQSAGGLISFGLVALLWFSSSVFVEIIDAMNVIVGVRETRAFWKRRLIAIAMTLSQAAILIATMVTIIAWPQIMNLIGLSRPASLLATFVHIMTVVVMVLLSFALALHVGPDIDQDWAWITPGSLLGTILLLSISLIFRVYAQTWGHYSVTYGSLAGVIVLMSWIWLSSVHLLVAAELNAVIEDASPLGDHRVRRRAAQMIASSG
jgi:membrane protein